MEGRADMLQDQLRQGHPLWWRLLHSCRFLSLLLLLLLLLGLWWWWCGWLLLWEVGGAEGVEESGGMLQMACCNVSPHREEPKSPLGA